jgi:type VI protein secretion system component VasK
MSEESARLSKQERRETRRRDAQRRKLKSRLRRLGIAAAVLAVLGLWVWEYSGPEELVEAEVIETRRWRHQANDGSSHPHISATLQIEGLREATLERADSYERGQRVLVWVRRGPISGRPYFLDVAKPGEIERQKRQDTDEKDLE